MSHGQAVNSDVTNIKRLQILTLKHLVQTSFIEAQSSVYSFAQFRKRAFYLVTAWQLWQINIQKASHVTKSRLKDQNSPLISLADRLSWNVGKCFTMTFSWSSVTLYFMTWSENYTHFQLFFLSRVLIDEFLLEIFVLMNVRCGLTQLMGV